MNSIQKKLLIRQNTGHNLRLPMPRLVDFYSILLCPNFVLFFLVNQQQQYLQPYQPVNSFFSQPSQPMQQTLQPQAQGAHHFYVDYFWV
jgi:hypothetical protein